jgi:hypothetical protein
MSQVMFESEPTNGNTLWRMRVACWINKATRTKAYIHTPTLLDAHIYKYARIHTHRNAYFLQLFLGKNGFADATQCQVTLTVLCDVLVTVVKPSHEKRRTLFVGRVLTQVNQIPFEQ